jgi:hypothetical protein
MREGEPYEPPHRGSNITNNPNTGEGETTRSQSNGGDMNRFQRGNPNKKRTLLAFFGFDKNVIFFWTVFNDDSDFFCNSFNSFILYIERKK